MEQKHIDIFAWDLARQAMRVSTNTATQLAIIQKAHEIVAAEVLGSGEEE